MATAAAMLGLRKAAASTSRRLAGNLGAFILPRRFPPSLSFLLHSHATSFEAPPQGGPCKREDAKPTSPPSIPSPVRLRLSFPFLLLSLTLSHINFGIRVGFGSFHGAEIRPAFFLPPGFLLPVSYTVHTATRLHRTSQQRPSRLPSRTHSHARGCPAHVNRLRQPCLAGFGHRPRPPHARAPASASASRPASVCARCRPAPASTLPSPAPAPPTSAQPDNARLRPTLPPPRPFCACTVRRESAPAPGSADGTRLQLPRPLSLRRACVRIPQPLHQHLRSHQPAAPSSACALVPPTHTFKPPRLCHRTSEEEKGKREEEEGGVVAETSTAGPIYRCRCRRCGTCRLPSSPSVTPFSAIATLLSLSLASPCTRLEERGRKEEADPFKVDRSNQYISTVDKPVPPEKTVIDEKSLELVTITEHGIMISILGCTPKILLLCECYSTTSTSLTTVTTSTSLSCEPSLKATRRWSRDPPSPERGWCVTGLAVCGCVGGSDLQAPRVKLAGRWPMGAAASVVILLLSLPSTESMLQAATSFPSFDGERRHSRLFGSSFRLREPGIRNLLCGGLVSGEGDDLVAVVITNPSSSVLGEVALV
ncbi:hypothetical protein Taro_001275 [Colocasia esculenta]|uniref:Uncharacterized protein n=1 Tax=Colocasia esculenta TaxID=4460 RepID=A0A843THB1_COLES|nr:hypothetical protein [Colocasia esculenta]